MRKIRENPLLPVLETIKDNPKQYRKEFGILLVSGITLIFCFLFVVFFAPFLAYWILFKWI